MATSTSIIGTLICGSSSRGSMMIAAAPSSTDVMTTSGVSFESMNAARAMRPARLMNPTFVGVASVKLGDSGPGHSLRPPRVVRRSTVPRRPSPRRRPHGDRKGFPFRRRRVCRFSRDATARAGSRRRRQSPTVRAARLPIPARADELLSPTGTSSRANWPGLKPGCCGKSSLTRNVRLTESAVGAISLTVPVNSPLTPSTRAGQAGIALNM